PIVTTALPSGSRTSPAAIIQLSFSQSMDPASTEGSFHLSPPVAGRFEWSDENRSLKFFPATALDSSLSYLGRLSASAKDAEGRPLDGNFDRIAQGSPLDDFTWS